jgi:uncharacterized protein
MLFQSAYAQQASPGIKALAKSKKEGVWLRWVPEEAGLWQIGNRQGYNIERFTLGSDGEMESREGILLTPQPVKPYTAAQLSSLQDSLPEAEALQGLLYDASPLPAAKGSTIQGALARKQALENRFGMTMLISDMAPGVARAAGLFWADATAQAGKRYIYRISLAEGPGTCPPAVLVVDVTAEQPLLQPKELAATFGDRTVTISWPTVFHKGVYTAYFIERSADGKKYQKISDLPFIQLSEGSNTETAYATDSLPENNKTYYYRIKGISPFGEVGPPSVAVRGAGTDNLSGMLQISNTKVVDNKKTTISWEFPAAYEKQIAGFVINRAPKPDGPWEMSSKKPLSSKLRVWIDESPYNNTYYVIKAVDKKGLEVAVSYPHLVHREDNTPPAVPTGINGTISPRGIASLTWKANMDADLLGYRIFKANRLTDEYMEISDTLLKSPAYTDTVNINVLDKKIFYKIVAVDLSYNNSDYSQALVLQRPDIIPPVPPVFTHTSMKDNAIHLKWHNSSSDDVAAYVLLRLEGDTSGVLLARWATAAAPTEFTDQTARPGQGLRYKLTVEDSTGNRSETVSKEVFFEPGYREAVKGIKATPDRELKHINLQWQYEAPAVKCVIYRKKGDAPYTLYKTLGGEEKAFTDKNLYISNTYSYKIQLVLAGGIKTLLSEEVKVMY